MKRIALSLLMCGVLLATNVAFVTPASAHKSKYCGHLKSGIATKTVFIEHWNKRRKIVRSDGSVWYYTDHRHRYAHGPLVVPPWDHVRVKSCN